MGNLKIDRVPFLAIQYRTCLQHRLTTTHLTQSWVGINVNDAQKLTALEERNNLLIAQLNEQIRKLSPADKIRFNELIADCV
jgi:hypothetical protein